VVQEHVRPVVRGIALSLEHRADEGRLSGERALPFREDPVERAPTLDRRELEATLVVPGPEGDDQEVAAVGSELDRPSASWPR